MEHHLDTKLFNSAQSIQLRSALPSDLCDEFITSYKQNSDNQTLIEEIIQSCRQAIFKGDLDELLREHFEGDYHIFCTSYDRVDSQAEDYSFNTYWHLDYGLRKSLKLFVYLNPVSEHGGNTLMIDQKRTEIVRDAGALPIEQDKRHRDVAGILQKLGLDTQVLAYDLKAGDALLFSPFILAHKCQPPRQGHERHTICYTITPPIG